MRIPVPFPCLPQKWNEAEEVGCQRPAWEWESAAQGKILGKRTRSTGNALATLLKQRGSLRAVTKHRFLPAAIAVTICSAQSSAALRSRRVQVRLAGQTEKGGIKCSAAHDPDALMPPYHCHLFPCIFISNFSWPLLNVNSCKCFKTYLNIWKYLSGWSKRYSLKLREVLRLSVQK